MPLVSYSWWSVLIPSVSSSFVRSSIFGLLSMSALVSMGSEATTSGLSVLCWYASRAFVSSMSKAISSSLKLSLNSRSFFAVRSSFSSINPRFGSNTVTSLKLFFSSLSRMRSS